MLVKIWMLWNPCGICEFGLRELSSILSCFESVPELTLHKNSSFSNCVSTLDGSIVQSYDGAVVTITSTRFENLHSSGYGGALVAIGSKVQIEDTTFRNCSSDQGGGALSASTYLLTGSENSVATYVSVVSSSFDECSSNAYGGAVNAFTQSSQFNPMIKVHIYSAQFIKCLSSSGGAIYASGLTVDLQIQNCSYLLCQASISGGALAADDLAQVKIASSLFVRNAANGLGGGGVYVRNAFVDCFNSTFSHNTAASGGGGSLYWQGNIRPSLQWNNLCDFNNSAAYGTCIASDLKILAVVSPAGTIFPGLEFNILVEKRDAYGQIISTDSSSLIEIVSVLDKPEGLIRVSDPSFTIQGETIVQMYHGVANFTISVEPTFSVLDSEKQISQVNHAPSIYFTGDDSQALIQSTMSSATIQLEVGNGSAICPRGYILSVQKLLSQGFSGTCEFCGQGTYSLNPLKGILENDPSCLTCPVGGNCRGGVDVAFAIGRWIVSDGAYLLISCPDGYQLVDYAQMGTFSQTNQQCVACSPDQYITDSDNSSILCQQCPVGALCNGSSLTGLVNGSQWVIDQNDGQYVLDACPPGYERVNTDASGQFSFIAQECLLCSAGKYCIGGIVSAISCPAGYFAPPGAKSLNSCEPAVFVNVVAMMSISEADFSSAKQALYIQALATTVNISAGDAFISSVSQTRRSESGVFTVIVSDLAASNQEQASSWAQRVDQSIFNIELAKRGLPSCNIQSISVQTSAGSAQSGLNVIAVALGSVAAVAAFIIANVYICIFRHRSASRRLIGSAPGTKANQDDLPYELRDKYEALHVLGCGAFGVILEVVFIHSGIRTRIRRAIKLVHSTHKQFTNQELRRLDREVCAQFHRRSLFVMLFNFRWPLTTFWLSGCNVEYHKQPQHSTVLWIREIIAQQCVLVHYGALKWRCCGYCFIH